MYTCAWEPGAWVYVYLALGTMMTSLGLVVVALVAKFELLAFDELFGTANRQNKGL
jgi:hypothetical protein